LYPLTTAVGPEGAAAVRGTWLSISSVAASALLAAACTAGSGAVSSRPIVAASAGIGATDSMDVSSPTGRPIDAAELRGRIVFSNGTSDIWIVNADGSGLRRLTRNPANDFDPTLSPDGTQIAFRSERDGNNEIYVMRSDGSNQHDVSSDATDDWGPTWSPDGRVLWNCARGLITGFRACVADADGGATGRVHIHRYVEYMAWSPDGSMIAFMSQEHDAFGDDPNYNVYVANADGTGLRRLTTTQGSDGFPSWSPDGRMIAFTSTRDDCGNSNAPDCKTTGDIGPYHTLYLMNAAGSGGQRRVTDVFAQFVDWSPDGRYLVFSPGLNIIRPDGTGLVTLHPPGVGEVEFADWGPA
jgi:Tol biopolymer transport system component